MCSLYHWMTDRLRERRTPGYAMAMFSRNLALKNPFVHRHSYNWRPSTPSPYRILLSAPSTVVISLSKTLHLPCVSSLSDLTYSHFFSMIYVLICVHHWSGSAMFHIRFLLSLLDFASFLHINFRMRLQEVYSTRYKIFSWGNFQSYAFNLT